MEEIDVKRKEGGMITMPFIFANEMCNKLALVGFNANMITYLICLSPKPPTSSQTSAELPASLPSSEPSSLLDHHRRFHCLRGMAEAFMSIGHLEFFYDQAPESMRSTATALFWTAISLGNYLSTLLVSLVHKYSAKPDGSNLNEGKLEYFYWLITALQFVNLVYYLFCVKYYTVQVKNAHTNVEPTNKV